jgi:hypothetical protein
MNSESSQLLIKKDVKWSKEVLKTLETLPEYAIDPHFLRLFHDTPKKE